jgi:hypothetical protein
MLGTTNCLFSFGTTRAVEKSKVFWEGTQRQSYREQGSQEAVKSVVEENIQALLLDPPKLHIRSCFQSIYLSAK